MKTTITNLDGTKITIEHKDPKVVEEVERTLKNRIEKANRIEKIEPIEKINI